LAIFDFHHHVQNKLGAYLRNGSVGENKRSNDELLLVVKALDEHLGELKAEFLVSDEIR